VAPRWVKKRDGRIEPFDEARIARAITRAGRRVGRSDEVEQLGLEIARSVAHFLARHNDRTPETELIASAMLEALQKTGHGAIARMARDWRDWRQRRSAAVRIRGEVAPAKGSVEVLSRGAARPWTKQRIVQALVQQAKLEQEAAEEVARAVEERVFAAGLNQVSTTLLRELIDAELFERGFAAQLGRLEVVGVPKEDMERLGYLSQGRPPLALEDTVARTALERYALDELVAGKGAVAHRRGDVHLAGLGRPYRMAAGSVDVPALLAADPPARLLDAVRVLGRAGRKGYAAYEMTFGMIGFEQALAPLLEVEGDGPLRDALDVFVDMMVTPWPDDVPPSPEIVLVVDAHHEDPSATRVVSGLVEVLAERGTESAGLRLLVRMREPDPEVLPLLESLIRAAKGGANCDLVLGLGEGLLTRGMVPGAAAVQVGLVNLAGLALGAGRGERGRLSRGISEAVEAVLGAFHKRRRRVFSPLVRPASPLFGLPPEPGAEAARPEPRALGDALGVVGLEAAMRYLTGEGIAENPRVAELAQEVLLELSEAIEKTASRLGLGSVSLEEVPEGDAGIRLAALDLERFEDARELLGEAPGWDVGMTLHGAAQNPLHDVRVRLWLARKLGNPLYLGRPLLASAPDEAALARGLLEALGSKGSGRPRESRSA